MSPRSWRERVMDILEAITQIQQFTRDMEFDEFRNDLKTLHAVILNLVIIGEAANAISAQLESQLPELPWHQIRGMRNWLVHHYFSIAPQILWATIQNDLPILAQKLEGILEENAAD